MQWVPQMKTARPREPSAYEIPPRHFQCPKTLPPRERLNVDSTSYIQRKKSGAITALGPRPGFYVSATSPRMSEQRMWDCDNFVDAENIPYFVYPPNRNGIKLGDVGIIVYIPSLKSARPQWTAVIRGGEQFADSAVWIHA